MPRAIGETEYVEVRPDKVPESELVRPPYANVRRGADANEVAGELIALERWIACPLEDHVRKLEWIIRCRINAVCKLPEPACPEEAAEPDE